MFSKIFDIRVLVNLTYKVPHKIYPDKTRYRQEVRLSLSGKDDDLCCQLGT